MHPALVRRILYPAYRALRHDRVLAYLEEMRRIQVAEPEDIRRFRWEKLRTLLDYAARNVPYYRDLFKRMGVAPEAIRTETDFAALPLLRKRDILRDPEAFVSEVYPRSRLSRDSTGGSTGENLFFSVGREARQAASANAKSGIPSTAANSSVSKPPRSEQLQVASTTWCGPGTNRWVTARVT